jgi:hypothetical protein
MRSTAYKKQGAPDRRSLIQQKVYTFYTHSTAYKKKGAPDQRSSIQQKVYAFYTRSTMYKKPGVPDRQSLTQQKLMLFTRVAPRTKSKRLLIGGPLLSKNLCFLHV